MKRHVVSLVRNLGMLPAADQLLLLRSRLRARRGNRLFAHTYPDFRTPPDDLSFDAYHHVDHTAYRHVGRLHAALYASVIAESGLGPRLSVLEWGCGPARVIRHLRDFLPNHQLALTGTDANTRSIAWCQQNIPGIEFAVNDFMPPLPFPDASFDVAINFSVFTHLSEQSQLAWAKELLRVLIPGGLLICSTHGDTHSARMSQPGEAARYKAGHPIIQARYEEGKKWYLALHPPDYVRGRLLADFTDLRKVAVGPESDFAQDLWSARRPA